MLIRRCLTLTAGLLAAAAIAGCALLSVNSRRARGPDAGYFAFAKVHSISASWRVPRILAHSANGSASTWIGTQNNYRAFIQVGITENRSFGSGYVHSPHTDSYDAFWSATPLQFHPHQLFPVAPGDHIFAELRHVDLRWIVAISDMDSGRQRVFSTTTDGGPRFNQGEWLQEDPSWSNRHNKPPFRLIRYPAMSTVHFTAAKLNGLTLAHWPRGRQSMAARGGTVVVTTRAHGSSFSIHALHR